MFGNTELTDSSWRKHYAKDKHGHYRGTEAPAEDCLLLAEDEKKWRPAPVHQEADQKT